jgi:XapX domain-containing protein
MGNQMKPYLISLLMGVLVGLLYGGVGVKSPAPPTIALVGLLGMLAGEQLMPLLRPLFAQLMR